MSCPVSVGCDRRLPRRLRVHVALMLLLGTASVMAEGLGAVVEAAPDASRQRELLRLLRQDCGSCHGMRLTGGLGPPLTPAALQDKPVASLTATILDGRRDTAMPPWRPFMSEAEAAWLAGRMQQGDVHAR